MARYRLQDFVAAPNGKPHARLASEDPQVAATEAVEITKLGTTNAVLAVRPGARFERTGTTWKLISLDPNLPAASYPLANLDDPASPAVDHNPFNFVDWHGSEPWCEPATNTHEDARHDRESPDRISGRIHVTLTARTQVFVPSGGVSPQSTEQGFWRCKRATVDTAQNAERSPNRDEHYGLPGTSVRGPTHSNYEVWTNSRTGVLDSRWKDRILYRRRSTDLYKITRLPTHDQPGEVVKLRWCYELTGGSLVDPRGKGLAANNAATWNRPGYATREPLRANLYWVPLNLHSHTKVAIRFRPTQTHLALAWKVKETYEYVCAHPQMLAHLQHVRTAARSGGKHSYRLANGPHPTEPEIERGYGLISQEREAHLAALRGNQANNGPHGSQPRCDLIYGFDDGQQVLCFGKNVNFLWPATYSPLDLIGEFKPRSESQQRLSESDMAERTFGFAGKNREASHPFASRVTFSTFWGEPVDSPDVEQGRSLELMPALVPAGARAKARALYVAPAPGASSRAQSYGDAIVSKEKLRRGVKMYWLQMTGSPLGAEVPEIHRYDKMTLPEENAPRFPDAVRARPIQPLPAGSKFIGEVDFSNLTVVELGALLVALSPGLALETLDGEQGREFGIKIGKGKPYALGSMTAELEVRRLTPASDRYRELSSPIHGAILSPREVGQLVQAYKEWATARARVTGFEEISFVQDLRRLLRLPTQPAVRMYPPRFRDYDWPAGFRSAAGDPDGRAGRPPGMKRARDLPPDP